jgi:hypothetical protein
MAYLETPLEKAQAAMANSALDGFNPLKAIGRALGQTGRALVAAIPGVGPAATEVLNVAARMPAKGGQPAPQASGSPTAAPTSASLVQQGSQPSDRDALLERVVSMMATNQAQPQAQPSPQHMVIQQPAAAASSMPPWLIPAAIGGAALLLLMKK